MRDLINFLLARIAEDEEWARLSASPDYSDGEPGTPGHSTRVLAECEAKRRIVELSQGWAVGSQSYHEGVSATISVVLRLLALPFADHSDYMEEWKP